MKLKSNLLLLLTAAIWGFAFVAQRVGMDYVEPFTFNGIRFALGSVSLLPLMFYYKNSPKDADNSGQQTKSSLSVGLLAGAVLFIAASLQQIGLVYTTAGKAAFITGLYIVLVPVAGIFLRHSITTSVWLGSLLAVTGLYFLTVRKGFTMAYGDLLELIGTFFWAAHILLIGRFSRTTDTLKLAFSQFLTCSLLSLGTALFIENISLNGLLQAAIPLLYGGVCSVGIAYTLQIIGQKNASPSHAAIIMSMETVFGAVGGYLILSERLELQELLGCTLMLAGMLLSQMQNPRPQKVEPLAEPVKH